MSYSRFNPRLPLPGGDAAAYAILAKVEAVSIHASRCREAMRHRALMDLVQAKVSIHASRCREAMRATALLPCR